MKTDTKNKKQFIIDTAAELFKEKGYSASSVRDLAARVGLEPSSIYSHIRSKDELLNEICMCCSARFTDGMNNIYIADISPKKKVKALINLHLQIAFDFPASVTVFNDEWKFLNKPILTEFLQARIEYENKFKKILREGQKNGKFSFINVDLVFNIIIKTLSWSYTVVNKYSKEELGNEVTAFILKAIRK
ncbi:MAG: TetR/AcrR family transcriptional regulator [Saprospiraceae bacterium]|jgi:AcrR family transcriptional regulator|nr:TetR/AcrR family transcriptional regulator [Saprospiraceae bacterium]